MISARGPLISSPLKQFRKPRESGTFEDETVVAPIGVEAVVEVAEDEVVVGAPEDEDVFDPLEVVVV
jgi:hypothetical protein